MLQPEVIRKRIQKLVECLAFLERQRNYKLDEFLASPERYASTERFLQLAIESIDDTASHIVAEKNLGEVNASRDLPRLFRRHGFIDAALEERWIRMIGFRNILVHDYLEIDRSTVYSVLQNNLGDLRELQSMFARFL